MLSYRGLFKEKTNVIIGRIKDVDVDTGFMFIVIFFKSHFIFIPERGTGLLFV